MRSDPVEPAPLGLKIVAAAGLAFLHVPLALIVLYAFTTEERAMSFRPGPHHAMVCHRRAADRHMGGADAVAPGSGGPDAAGARAWNLCRCGAGAGPVLRPRDDLLLFVLPIALPGIITGIALRSAFNIMDFDFSFWTIVLGHATFCIVVVYNNAVARLRRTSPNLIEASMDLGADGLATLRHILLPAPGERCSRAACLPSRCRSTRSSSRPSRPDSNRRCQSGC